MAPPPPRLGSGGASRGNAGVLADVSGEMLHSTPAVESERARGP